MVQNHKPIEGRPRSRIAELRSERQAAATNPSAWTQASLARVVGASLRSVKAWEAGDTVPRPFYRHRLATALGASLAELGFPDTH
jgi:DNA-binding XRE family transcriptional regulator